MTINDGTMPEPTSEDLHARLRRARDDLERAREEASAARSDLAAMQDRLAEIERKARLGAIASRNVANVEFLERQQKEVAHHQTLLRLAKPLRGWRFFPALERLARRARAAIHS